MNLLKTRCQRVERSLYFGITILFCVGGCQFENAEKADVLMQKYWHHLVSSEYDSLHVFYSTKLQNNKDKLNSRDLIQNLKEINEQFQTIISVTLVKSNEVNSLSEESYVSLEYIVKYAQISKTHIFFLVKRNDSSYSYEIINHIIQ
jgi:hypothetical protein